MKDLSLKLSKGELRGLYNLTKMYIAGFQSADNEVAYLHSVMLMDYLDYAKKKLVYAKPMNNIVKIHLKYMPLFLSCGVRFYKDLPPFELSIALELNKHICDAVNQDKIAMRTFEDYNNLQK